MRTTLTILAVAPMLLACPALHAQTNLDETGTGGGPSSTITAPYTTSTGQTVPRRGADRLRERRDGDLTREERRGDRIDTGICIGCD